MQEVTELESLVKLKDEESFVGADSRYMHVEDEEDDEDEEDEDHRGNSRDRSHGRGTSSRRRRTKSESRVFGTARTIIYLMSAYTFLLRFLHSGHAGGGI